MDNLKNNLALRLQAIIDTAIDAIFTIDRYGIIESVNPAGTILFQYTASEMLGHNVKMLMGEPDHHRHDGYIRRYNETREAKIIGIGREVMGRKKDGTIFPLRLAVSEVVLDDRVIFTGVIHDLTEISEINRQLRDINEELELKVDKRTEELEKTMNNLLKVNRELAQREMELQNALEKEKELGNLKSRFVSMASHEFRTPLSTILSSVSLIARYTESDQQAHRTKHVDRIKSSVSNLTDILDEFLSITKLEEGKVSVQLEEVNLAFLCEEVITDMEGLLKENQRIHHGQTGRMRSLITDKRILKNVLFNLISNAVKYSKSDIHCKSLYFDSEMAISISDEGIGIPMDEQKFLFERFYRASNAESIQGTGLGLYIVKQYLTLLKGRIDFESRPSKGTTFTITLPYSL